MNMYSHGIHMALIAVFFILFTNNQVYPANGMNVIDKCWRTNPKWRGNRHQLARCSVGYAGKMSNNIGHGTTNYKVTDPSDDALNPKPGTLRYAMTHIKGKVWITFKRDMSIKLQKPLLISSFTAIDGRGVNVHIHGGGCLMLQRVNNVIIHSLRIHDCKAQTAGPVLGPDAKVVHLSAVDGDAIRILSSTKVWIDHNTLYNCPDGLIDVTRGSTQVTISNNWFRSQDKVMLLGHDDGFMRDKNMKVTVAFNHFGPRCHQRMPRVRFGYAHVVNNLYLGWGLYAIGGSMDPTVKSQSNLFIAPEAGNKEVTWRKQGSGRIWNFLSVGDVFENGASFVQSRGTDKGTSLKPNYTPEQAFPVEDARKVRDLTSSSGALKCSRVSYC
ncbi:OLC1v1014964C1 [Oldenlandia corymbosa var. corymbosa]|uniref:Pectate lyase n=1 Tax=Oldenlandia corymbosa var. corymbosa TaxID=529605 RepID=A0AAV1E2J1_OLDCO|nr:OLC1v1014964C1 [Oldenlandia corymbosa var. corymbosa]